MDSVEIRDPKLWDCESSLYDSFELKSFKDQLDSVLKSNTRCLSMPRLSDPYPAAPKKGKQSSGVFGSIHKLIRSVLRLKRYSKMGEFEIYGGYLSSDGLTTIPEGSEKGSESPEFDRTVRKTISERFTRTTGGVRALSS